MAHHAPRIAEIPGVFVFAPPETVEPPSGVILPALRSTLDLDRAREAYARVRRASLAPVALACDPSASTDAWELGLALMPELALVAPSGDADVLRERGALAMQYGVVPVWQALDAADVAAAVAASGALKRRPRVLCRLAAAREAAERDERVIVLQTLSSLAGGAPPRRATWGLWLERPDEVGRTALTSARLDAIATRAVLGCNEVREPCG